MSVVTPTLSGKRRSRLRALIVPGAVALAMLAILVGLGTWQVHRLAWKEAILAEIARAEAAPPVPMPARPSEFVKVRATGRLRTDLSVLYGAEVHGDRLGAQLVTPLERPGHRPLLVVRGWVPTEPRPADAPPGPATIDGYVHKPDRRGPFSAADNPGRRLFYTLDPAAIAAAVGLQTVAPYALVALGPPPASGPVPAQHLPRPPNDHFLYAVTWYSLAAGLLAVFIAFCRKTLREEPPDVRL